MDVGKERFERNEALFRGANERKYAWPEEQQKAMEGEKLTFWCECAVKECRERVRLTGFEYEAVRADPKHFILVPEHVFPDIERVVEDHGRYVVVRKTDDLRGIAERTDPRKRRQSPY